MFTIELSPVGRKYKNNGQQAELVFRYTLTGKTEKADNIKHTEKADCLNYQIKSAKATICDGENIADYVKTDKAEFFAYVISDFSTAYVMTKAEYIAFATKFGTKDYNSKTKAVKIRLKSESGYMIEYLKSNGRI